jgi:alginate O-acetyltransferase complex protein AlgI
MWLTIERLFGVNAAPKVINPLKWLFTFFLVMLGWVIFRAENLDIAWRMYSAMFSPAIFSSHGWQLSELNSASISDLQIATLVLAYAVMAFCGLRQFYRHKALDARADGPATDLSRMVKAVPGDEQGLVVGSGVLVQQATWSAAVPRYLVRGALLLLFCASLLKLSAQSYSPFLYFQF